MKITAADLLRLGVIHQIVYEPPGGAHRNHADAIRRLSSALRAEMHALKSLGPDELRTERATYYMQIGSA